MSFKSSRRPSEAREFSNPALQTAYRKGLRARRRGDPRSSCPYGEDPAGTPNPKKGWRRAFRIAWERGFDDGGVE